MIHIVRNTGERCQRRDLTRIDGVSSLTSREMRRITLLQAQRKQQGYPGISLIDLDNMGIPTSGTEYISRVGNLVLRIRQLTAEQIHTAEWLCIEQNRASYSRWGTGIGKEIRQPDRHDNVHLISDSNGTVQIIPAHAPYEVVHYIAEAYIASDNKDSLYMVDGHGIMHDPNGIPYIKTLSQRQVSIIASRYHQFRNGQHEVQDDLNYFNGVDCSGIMYPLKDILVSYQNHGHILEEDLDPEKYYKLLGNITTFGRIGTSEFGNFISIGGNTTRRKLSPTLYAYLNQVICSSVSNKRIICGIINREIKTKAFSLSEKQLPFTPMVEFISDRRPDIMAITLNRSHPDIRKYMMFAPGYWTDNASLATELHKLWNKQRIHPNVLERSLKVIRKSESLTRQQKSILRRYDTFGKAGISLWRLLTSPYIAKHITDITTLPCVQKIIFSKNSNVQDGPYATANYADTIQQHAQDLLQTAEFLT